MIFQVFYVKFHWKKMNSFKHHNTLMISLRFSFVIIIKWRNYCCGKIKVFFVWCWFLAVDVIFGNYMYVSFYYSPLENLMIIFTVNFFRVLSHKSRVLYIFTSTYFFYISLSRTWIVILILLMKPFSGLYMYGFFQQNWKTS